MPLLVSFPGVSRALRAYLNNVITPLRIRLFQNDYAPARTSNYADFQEATFPGYGGFQTLTGWTIPAQVGEDEITEANQVGWFVSASGAGNWIYGYYVSDNGNILQWAERLPNAPVLMAHAGSALVLTPKFSARSLF